MRSGYAYKVQGCDDCDSVIVIAEVMTRPTKFKIVAITM